MAVFSRPVLAQENESQPPLSSSPYLTKGMREFSLGTGWGEKIPLERFDDRSETRFFSAIPSLGYFIRDRQELVLEAPLLYYYSPHHGVAAGADLMYRYHFSRNRNFAPFIEAGAGVNYVDVNVPELTGKFQFSLQGGVGVRKKIGAKSDLILSLRWHHFSNAGTRQPNIGLNDSFLILSYSRFF